jgi:Holliday junction resolvase
MGRRSRDKGARTERNIVNVLQAAGFAAVRVPLSGAVGGRFGGDIVLPVNGRDPKCEVKCRGDGFKRLYDWLDGHDVLIAKADRREPLVIMRLSQAADIATPQLGREGPAQGGAGKILPGSARNQESGAGVATSLKRVAE